MNTAGSSGVNAAGRNAVVTSLMICCAFIACWSPIMIYVYLNAFGYNAEYWSPVYRFTVVLVLTSSCINPFIYAAKYREFQTAARRLLRSEVQPSA